MILEFYGNKLDRYKLLSLISFKHGKAFYAKHILSEISHDNDITYNMRDLHLASNKFLYNYQSKYEQFDID